MLIGNRITASEAIEGEKLVKALALKMNKLMIWQEKMKLREKSKTRQNAENKQTFGIYYLDLEFSCRLWTIFPINEIKDENLSGNSLAKKAK